MTGHSGPPADRPPQVFLSYSRKDLAKAELVRDRLKAAGFAAYLDKIDILPGEPWKERLAKLIEKADSVVFLLSPDSVASEICDWEVNEAERLAKRILPLVIRDASPDVVPGRLQRLNFIFWRNDDEEPLGLAKLGEALTTDIGWVRTHTRLGEASADWERATRRPELLLRGTALYEAERWISEPNSGGLTPTEAQRAYILASRSYEHLLAEEDRARTARTRKFQRRAAWGLAGTSLLLLAGVLGVIWQDIATTRREQAVFSQFSAEEAAGENFGLAMQYAMQAFPPQGALPWAPTSSELEGRLAVAATLSRQRRAATGHDKPIYRAAFSSDNRHFATAGADGKVHIWRITGDRDAFLVDAVAVLDGNGGEVNAVSFSPDGQRLATASDDGAARIWDVATQKIFATVSGDGLAGQDLEKPGVQLNAVSYSPDGRRLVTGASDRKARIIDLTTGKVFHTLAGHGDDVVAATYSSDGQLILTASSDKTARLWDANSGAHLRTLEGHIGRVTSARFIFNGERILTVSADRTVRHWETRTGKELRRFGGHASDVNDAAADPLGRRAVSVASDMRVRFFDLESGAGLGEIRTGEGAVIAAAWSGDGNWLVTAGQDKTARVWDASMLSAYGSNLRERACSGPLRYARWSDRELDRPAMRGIDPDDPVAPVPCLRRGPLSPDYWKRLIAKPEQPWQPPPPPPQ